MNDTYHEEINGVIIDVAEIFPGQFETMAMTDDGDELDMYTDASMHDAASHFNQLVSAYAEPRQAAFFKAGMVAGKRYTAVYFDEFGQLCADRFTLIDLHCDKYAQYTDAVRLHIRRAGARKVRYWYNYSGTVLIYSGWRTLPEHFGFKPLTDKPDCQTWMSKYHCFDDCMIEDVKAIWPDYIGIAEDVRTGAICKRYA